MTYETALQRERRARAERRAERLLRKAVELDERSRAQVEGIPLGQPILVGHHSERRHRRALEKSRALGLRAYELGKAAQAAESAAQRAGSVITADDPEALEALRAKLDRLESGRELWKGISKALRSKEPEAALRALGLRENTIAACLEEGRVPSYVLQNLGANIRRVRARIEEIEARSTAKAREPVVGDGWRLEEDLDDCRARIYFDGKPSAELRAKLKAEGWRWSPSAGAWQRQATNAAWCSALRILGLEP